MNRCRSSKSSPGSWSISYLLREPFGDLDDHLDLPPVLLGGVAHGAALGEAHETGLRPGAWRINAPARAMSTADPERAAVTEDA